VFSRAILQVVQQVEHAELASKLVPERLVPAVAAGTSWPRYGPLVCVSIAGRWLVPGRPATVRPPLCRFPAQVVLAG